MFAATSATLVESAEGQHPNYYVGGTIARELGEDRHPTSGHRQFEFVDAVKVRKGKSNKETGAHTLPAYEITLKVLGDNVDSFMQQVQAGQVFAFEPRNHRKDVAKIKKILGNPEGMMQVPVNSAYLASEGEQTVSVDDALSGVVDLSAPSKALVKLLNERVRSVGGAFLEEHDVDAVVRSYTVDEVIAHAQDCYAQALDTLKEHMTPGNGTTLGNMDLFPRYVMNVRDLVLNQPSMNARPYTFSNIDREKGEVKIVVGDVAHTLSAENPFGLTDAKGQPLGERVKRDGNATGMLRWMRLHNHKQGPFRIGGSIDTQYNKLAFMGVTPYTESIAHAKHSVYKDAQGVERKKIEDPSSRVAQIDMLTNPDSRYDTGKPVETIYLVATGTGIAPYLALLREMKQKKDRGEELPSYNIVLAMGGRFQQDKIAHKELCQYVDEGLLEAYHFISSSDQKEYIRNKDGQQRIDHKETGQGGVVKYAQHALAYHYKDRVQDELMRDGAYIYLCGTKKAEVELVEICPEKLSPNKERPHALLGTASLPSRFRDDFDSNKTQPHVESQKEFLGLVANAWGKTLAQLRGMRLHNSRSQMQDMVENIVTWFRDASADAKKENPAWQKVQSTNAAAIPRMKGSHLPKKAGYIGAVQQRFADAMAFNNMILEKDKKQVVQGRRG